MSRIVDRILLILNLLAAASLLISYLSPLINPAKFMVPAIFGLAYPFLLILNLAFICYWIIRLKKEIFLSLIVVLLGWGHLNNLLPLNFKDARLPESIPYSQLFKVLSYNVRGFNIYDWNSDPQIKNDIMGFLEEEDPDIVCFQEYYTSAKRGETESDLAKDLDFLPQSAVYYTSNRKSGTGFGIATYSRYPIIKKSRIPFNSSSNAAMYTDIVVRSDTTRVINVHLQSIRFRKEDYAFMDTVRLKYSSEQMRGLRNIGSQLKKAFSLRSEQADMITQYIKSSPYPVVVMGDFNDTPQSYAYRRIKRGMQDAFKKAGKGFGNTYAGELPSFRIDYILYGKPMDAYNFRRIKNRFSDHFPISAWIHRPPPANAE